MVYINTICTAFEGSKCIATGELRTVAMTAKLAVDAVAHKEQAAPVLVFDNASSEVIELDWRGSVAEFQERLDALPKAPEGEATCLTPATCPDAPQITTGPGRPKLGVVAREVTLLPRHWEWLATQTGGASVTLRKLVEVARRTSEVKDRVARASAVGYKFMSTMAGHEPGFEEASRALFAGDLPKFETITADWPADIQTHLKKLLADAFWA